MSESVTHFSVVGGARGGLAADVPLRAERCLGEVAGLGEAHAAGGARVAAGDVAVPVPIPLPSTLALTRSLIEVEVVPTELEGGGEAEWRLAEVCSRPVAMSR